MKNVMKLLRKYWPVLLAELGGIAFLVAAAVSHSFMRNPSRVAQRTESKLEKRLDVLGSYTAMAMSRDTADWLAGETLPEDMVIYRYRLDSLRDWAGCFIAGNDDIRAHYFSYQRLNRPEYGVESPLADLTSEWRCVGIGPRWYLARMVSDGVSTKVVEALELCSVSSDGQICDINPELELPDFYKLEPLAWDVGVEVKLDGAPVFLISCPNPDTTYIFADSVFRWIGLALLTAALLIFLYLRRNWGAYAFTQSVLLLFYHFSAFWGGQMTDTMRLFSPSLYAGGTVWSSFGALILLDLLLIFAVASLYMMRRKIVSRARRSRGGLVTYTVFLALALAATVAYTVCSICSIVGNSGISFEIQWFNEGVAYTIAALVMNSLMFVAALKLLQMMAVPVMLLTGRRMKVTSPAFLVATSVAVACLLFFLPDSLGFRKEQQRVNVWANRLAVDRDLALELHLRSIEKAVASDQVLAMVSASEGSDAMMENRVRESYLLHFANEYEISLESCAANDADCMSLFSRKLSGGVPIADGSRFLCVYQTNGKARYVALFTYSFYEDLVTRVLVEVIPRSSREDDGYYSIFTQLGKPGGVNLPEEYSYAKYVDGRLVSYKGTYPYPTVISDRYLRYAGAPKSFYRTPRAVIFVNEIDENEQIVISRRRRTPLQIASSSLTVLAAVALVLSPLAITRRRRHVRTKNTFRRRINIILAVAISLSLISIAAISIKFVFERNAADSYNVMSSKITTIQNMVEHLAMGAHSYRDLVTPEFRNSLMEVGLTTKSDISMYTPDGRVFVSTVSEVFDMMLLSPRISSEAYGAIVHDHQRIHIAKENFEGRRYNDLYAPVFNGEDEMVAIVASPLSRGVSVMKEAVPHAVLMFILVLTLLVIFLFATARAVGAVFSPLTEISRNMEAAGAEGLKVIDYPHEDEISGLISSYNRMVHDLEESTRRMAENERDMAWSEMARQVAHEIKNPLTPMKLAVQRLARLKAKNDPTWAEKFDDLSMVVLDQIDILTETANDFSTFAKLYTEDPVEVDLDVMLQEQMTIFDNKDNVEMVYLGMPDAFIMAPRPQLIRVFVNLITNAIQAIEINQREVQENGGTPVKGKVMVSLRNSTEDGFYDVVVEDNGPGVSEENQSKIFTPKFTTKSAGTGLGLAISRNIVTKCGGEISYMRSFSLSGAAFLVRLPKKA